MHRSVGLVALALVVLPALVPCAAAQFQVLFTEDFEDGLRDWVTEDFQPLPEPLWHLAEEGECGAGLTRMLGYGLPEPVCTYATGTGSVVSEVFSAPFMMEGHEPFLLEYDGIWGFDPGTPGNLASSTPFLENTATGDHYFLIFTNQPLKEAPGVLKHVSNDFSMPPSWAGVPVRLGFQSFSLTQQPSTGFGMRYDNIQLRSSAYEKFGEGVPGVSLIDGAPYHPLLFGHGTLIAGSANDLLLNALNPNSLALLVFGLQTIDLPFKGGVMYPEPSRLWVLPTGDSGPGTYSQLEIPFVMPPLPAGVSLYIQLWVQDATGAQGWVSSRALEGVTS